MVGLTDVLNSISEGKSNRFSIQRQEVIDLNVALEGGNQKGVVSIYTGSKYAQFHGEFTQIALTIPSLQFLIQYLDQEGYKTNLD